MRLRNVATIAVKDLVDALKNFRLLAIVLMPIALSIVFGLLYRDTPSGSTIVVYDPGESQIVTSIGATDGWSLWEVDSEADVERAMTEQEALAGLVLPADFDARLAAGERPPLKLMLNGAQERRFNARRLVIDLVISQSGRPLPVDLAETIVNPPQAGGESAPAPASALQGLSIQGWFLVTWSVMSIAMVGMYMVPTLLVEEKERKTLDAMMVAPVSYVDLIAGKALVGLVYAVLSAGLIFLLNAPEEVHSVGGLILIGVLSALFATLIGLWLGGMFGNTQSLNTWGSLPMLAFLAPVILAPVPSSSLWSILQVFPPTHTVEGVARALSGESPDRVWVNVLVLAASCVLAGALVWISLRRRERG
ncbi:MAG TPA: ABC transporter permease [Anaerolineae bacterium]|nr:ABC transporter permease [Anaerolineae bacterium]